jgi:hypothetical protein
MKMIHSKPSKSIIATSLLASALIASNVASAQSRALISLDRISQPTQPSDVQIVSPIQISIDDAKLQSTIGEAIDQGLEKLHQALSTLDAKTQTLVAEHAKDIVASVDVNEIRDTVRRAMEEASKAGSFSYRMSGDEVQKGNPYSSRETREFKQTLGDGNVIARQSTRLLARDGEGRTRQELRQPDGTSRIFINDPVAKRSYIIDPQKRSACKAGFDKDAINDCFKQMRGDWKPLGFTFSPTNQGIPLMTANDDVKIHVSSNARVIDFTKDSRSESGSRGGAQSGSRSGVVPPVPPVPPAPPLPPLPPMPGSLTWSQSSDGAAAGTTRDSKVTRETSTTTYENLRVDVNRTVETIAVGALGNNRPLETVFERYYSPDLKMTVYSKRSDPRSGETIYRMTEIKRSEPDASLFRVPSGFSEIDGKSK